MKALFLILSLGVSLASWARETEFTWQASPEALEYELQVSETRNFEKLVLKQITQEPQVKAELNFGNYFYRIRAFDHKKRAGLWSRPQSLSIKPYSPTPIRPEKEASFNYFEKKALIPFEWKALEGDAKYEVLVRDSTGKKVFEQSTSENPLLVNQLTEGNYLWQVRAVFQGKLYSQYSASIPFQVTRTPLKSPQLIHPKNDSDIPAFRGDRFEWTKDPATKFTDIQLERTDKKENIDSIKNLEDLDHELPALMPGKYRWRVITKEAEDTIGSSSEWAKFKTSTSVISSQDHSFRFATGVLHSTYSFESDRFGSVFLDGKSQSSFLEVYKHFQMSRSFGLALELDQTQLKSHTFDSESYSSSSLYAEFRFGENDFVHTNILGYRFLDQYDLDSSGRGQRLSIYGPLIGMNMEGYLGFSQKLRLRVLYYKPTKSLQSGVNIKSDFYELRLSYAYNLLERFWLEYELSMKRGVTEVTHQSTDKTSKITTEWFSPLGIKFSYEY